MSKTKRNQKVSGTDIPLVNRNTIPDTCFGILEPPAGAGRGIPFDQPDYHIRIEVDQQSPRSSRSARTWARMSSPLRSTGGAKGVGDRPAYPWWGGGDDQFGRPLLVGQRAVRMNVRPTYRPRTSALFHGVSSR